MSDEPSQSEQSQRMDELRREYRDEPLDESHASDSPFELFSHWFDQAAEVNTGPWFEPNAMTLATVGPDTRPDARIVLLKSFDSDGFVFFTNYASQKGRQILANRRVALVFYWGDLERSVRVTGRAEKLDAATCREYFARRPRGSQLGAAVSRQSEIIPGREILRRRLAELEQQYRDQAVPMPATWGGYRVVPDGVEFWQGRSNRLHDRIRFRRRDDGGWTRERLSP